MPTCVKDGARELEADVEPPARPEAESEAAIWISTAAAQLPALPLFEGQLAGLEIFLGKAKAFNSVMPIETHVRQTKTA